MDGDDIIVGLGIVKNKSNYSLYETLVYLRNMFEHPVKHREIVNTLNSLMNRLVDLEQYKSGMISEFGDDFYRLLVMLRDSGKVEELRDIMLFGTVKVLPEKQSVDIQPKKSLSSLFSSASGDRH